jgi:hypothetical protein
MVRAGGGCATFLVLLEWFPAPNPGAGCTRNRHAATALSNMDFLYTSEHSFFMYNCVVYKYRVMYKFSTV